jgi:hypothetical protein
MTLNDMIDGKPSLHTGGVTGSIPVAPTSKILIFQGGLAERAREPLRLLATEQNRKRRLESVENPWNPFLGCPNR